MPSGRPRFAVPIVAALLIARAAGAQVPPASPLGILGIPVSQVPAGANNSLGMATGLDVSKHASGAWSWRDGEVRTDLLATIANWDRVELLVALPLRLRPGPSIDAQAAGVGLANRIAVAPIHLGGKLVLRRRPEGARGYGVALRIGSELPLDDVATARFSVELGAVADVRLARGILLAAHLAFAGSARYRVEDPAFESIAWGLGLRVPLAPSLALLGELWGRTSLGGSISTEVETSAGLQVRVDRVFLTGSAGLSLADTALLFRLAAHVGGGDGHLPPSERDDTPPPEDGCIEARCTRQQRAAVARAHAARLDAIRARLVEVAGRIERRVRAQAPREIVRLPVDNDLTIANDGERKRELSVRFLVAAFARGGVPLDRAIARRLIDATGWRVQVDRAIDERRVDYFTFDLPRLGAAYADLLRADAARLREAIAALRAADAGTTAIFLDIGRGYANGFLCIVNGLLDLPLAPINMGLLVLDRPGVRGLGRIPHLPYRSDWGRTYGASLEVGVALGTMTAPGAAAFRVAGRAAAPPVAYLAGELSALVWNGIPIGRMALGILSRWMAGSVVAIKMHAAADLAAIARAFWTGLVELPGQEPRPMTEDDLEQLLLAAVTDIALIKGVEEAKEEVARWDRPSGWRLPKKGGVWQGERGNSAFKPHDPVTLGLKPDDVIVFRLGWADFSPWMVDELEVPGMTGHRADYQLIYKKLAEQRRWIKPDGTPNASKAQDWLRQNNLTPHHAGGYMVQIVPTELHENVAHMGGAFELRNR